MKDSEDKLNYEIVELNRIIISISDNLEFYMKEWQLLKQDADFLSKIASKFSHGNDELFNAILDYNKKYNPT